MPKWTSQDIPDLTGYVAVVTGANGGLGYESALALARKNAHVILASRNMDKGNQAFDTIRKIIPEAKLTLMHLDLGSLSSVHKFADEFNQRFDKLHILINNAGVMAPPRGETDEGFELQFGINHLGHFALTGLLLHRLIDCKHSRVVSVSSTANYMGRINFDDLQSEKDYNRYLAYGQSKLANVMFAFELHRRLREAGHNHVLSSAAHPGLSNTDLQTTTAHNSGNALEGLVYSIVMPLLSQNAEQGAWPQLYAATASDAKSNSFYGPRILQTRGYPITMKANKLAYNAQDAKKLWEISEQLTGVQYVFTADIESSSKA